MTLSGIVGEEVLSHRGIYKKEDTYLIKYIYSGLYILADMLLEEIAVQACCEARGNYISIERDGSIN